MKSKFPGYYKPTEDEFAELWKEGIIVLDTNVLLDLYRYTDSTVKYLLDIIEQYKDKIWIPYQVSLEYHNNLNETIITQIKSYTKTIKTLEDFKNQLDAKKSHPFLETNLHDEINSFCKKFDDELQKKKEEIERLIIENPIKESVASALDNSVGDDFTNEDLEKIYNEGAQRYSKECPPGFKDHKKPTHREQYGDLIVWKEMIKKSNQDNKPIIFVTGDLKDDWFLNRYGKTIGPRPELIHEFKKQAQKLFYIYPTPRFLEYADKYLDLEKKVEKTIVEEVESIMNEHKQESTDTFDDKIYQDSVNNSDTNTGNLSNTSQTGSINEGQIIPDNTGSTND